MLRGWFDAFRSGGGPTLYAQPNRTPAAGDVRDLLLYVAFATVFAAFLLVFPGIRKEKFSTFISVTISLFVGAVILISNYGSEWHVAGATIEGAYRAFSRDKIQARLHVKVGLNSVNITLQATSIHKHSEDINYNERFRWVEATEMKAEYRAALRKGLPFPLLTVAEYFTQELEGFCWGRRYRLAGYYAHILLWGAFSLWLLMCVLLCCVPRYGAYTMQATGALMLAACALYALLLPRRPLVIPFEGAALHFRFGWSFWSVLAAGAASVAVGGAVALLDVLFPHKFATILELDYGMAPSGHQGAQKQASLASSTADREGFENVAYEDDYSTMVDGRRAVSLSNFGKFARREGLAHPHSRNLQNFTSDSYKPSTSKDVNIDISAAALW